MVKRDLSKLFSKGLTGREGGLLVFKDSWRVYQGESPLFRDSEVERLKNNLIKQDDKTDYKGMIELWKSTGQIFRLAMFDCVMAAWLLERLTRSVQLMSDVSLFADLASMNCAAAIKPIGNPNMTLRGNCFNGWAMPPLNDEENRYWVEEGIDCRRAEIMEALKAFVAKRQVLEELSEVLGYDFLLGAGMTFISSIELSLDDYNYYALDAPPDLEKLLKSMRGESVVGIDGDLELGYKQLGEMESSHGLIMAMERGYPRLKPIKLENIQPDEDQIREYREWVSESLGDNWWQLRPRWCDAVAKDVNENHL